MVYLLKRINGKMYFSNISKNIKLVTPKILFILVLYNFNFYIKITSSHPCIELSKIQFFHNDYREGKVFPSEESKLFFPELIDQA